MLDIAWSLLNRRLSVPQEISMHHLVSSATGMSFPNVHFPQKGKNQEKHGF